MKRKNKDITANGQITFIEVKGAPGVPTSAQVVFTLTSMSGIDHPMNLLGPPTYLPEVFAAMTSLLIAAYESKETIVVEYQVVDDVGQPSSLSVGAFPRRTRNR